jgi:hypothetical protein
MCESRPEGVRGFGERTETQFTPQHPVVEREDPKVDRRHGEGSTSLSAVGVHGGQGSLAGLAQYRLGDMRFSGSRAAGTAEKKSGG